ncbi:Alcohol dehydrogenase zinc-binding domain protein [Gloeothece citriformis PCC 7424]|uniref:Alcohol dehydrogenase zinc-binding domain protein n=1 Tax=Gloeothece citriformis (strain PCC 7424) TaxID=65393 RepID=B7KCY1_GLOC7|nr:zinc-dependent alcohol dehydrogenase family protein [Gloeothece citriformis]ACK73102.1 Alcohol dehydrogenase zinc-binding domain protein [Gloeothece citriformis PCC 7424]
MKAIVMSSTGAPDVLQLQEVPTPQIKSQTEILIKVKAAGINPVDTKIRSRGTFYPEQKAAILGCDGAGIVEAVGAEVKKFKVGDEVYYCAGGLGKPDTGNYAEYAVVEEYLVAPKPKSITFAEAASAPLVLITAWEALYDRALLKAGQKALIHAGTGGVGHVAIQLAKIRGAEVCTTVSSQDKARLARQFGADYPILYTQTDFSAAALEWTEGKGVDVAFDTVGGKTFFDTVPAVRVYGDLVTILEPDGSKGTLKVARNRNLRISLELMLTPALMGLREAQEHQTEILSQCGTWIDEGKLNIHLSQTYPLADAVEAHKQVETGSTTGKVALVMD